MSQQQSQQAVYRLARAVVKKSLKPPYPAWSEDAVQEMVLYDQQHQELPGWKRWLKLEDILERHRRRADREQPAGLRPPEPEILAPDPGDYVSEAVAAAQAVAQLMALPWSVAQRECLQAVYDTGNPVDAAARLGWPLKRLRNTLLSIRTKAIEAGIEYRG